ncbi:MAG: phosphodiester glycosidase family protein [Mesorhizobium sp.]
MVWKRLVLALVLVLLALGGAVWWISQMRSDERLTDFGLPRLCVDRDFENQSFIVCYIDLSTHSIRLALNGPDGKPYEHLDRLPKPFALAMNAGMYHADFSPVGLFVENGKELAPLNTDSGDGNFFMKPNGVFFIDEDGQPGVMETSAYAAADIRPQFATQSGPMLVVDGDVHRRFEPDGQSRYIRNGAGVDEKGRVVLAISRDPVSLGRFAQTYSGMRLPVAMHLFFDGGISALYDGARYVVGGSEPAGPMLIVQSWPG